MLNINDIQNSKVLVRVAFDLPTLDDTARVYDATATIKHLLSQNNKIVLISKWGRPKDQDPSLSMEKMISAISSIFQQEINVDLRLEFVNQFESFEQAKLKIENSNAQIIVLENAHFDSREKAKDSAQRLEIANEYAKLADYFIDEAFPSSHRNEATNAEIKDLLPWTYGLAYANELKNLDKIKEHPISPMVIVMAGAKLETKLPLIAKLIDKADKIILGGLLSFTFVQAATKLGWADQPAVCDTPVETEFLPIAKELLLNHKDKLVLPLDFIFEDEGGKTYGRDIGPKTQEYFQNVVKDAKTLFWNGTLGFYEKPPFDRGTLDLAGYIASLDECFKAIGGGDTNSSLPGDILEKFDFVSMGGGATLEYLSK